MAKRPRKAIMVIEKFGQLMAERQQLEIQMEEIMANEAATKEEYERVAEQYQKNLDTMDKLLSE